MGSPTMQFGVWLPSFTWEDDAWVLGAGDEASGAFAPTTPGSTSG